MNNLIDSKTQAETFDIYQEVTSSIIEAIAAGAGRWKMPWYCISELPRNIHSSKEYRGINTLVLWCQSIQQGYLSPEWGTYRQWSERNAQVKRGEKSTLVVFWKVVDRNDKRPQAEEAPDLESESELGSRQVLFARGYRVFNAEQVVGYCPELTQARPRVERIAVADTFFQSLGATIHRSDRAAYRPSSDDLLMPPFEAFIAAEPYYSCLGHEYIHWTGAAHRLNRSLTTRFGSEGYAAEELVAELGAAFLCATLGFSTTYRKDHAAYIQSWLALLKNDKKAIFNAASHAQKAADFLQAMSAKRNSKQTGETHEAAA
jgi:antirestriction protein ArdC